MITHTKGPMTVGYDGSSRPIILAPDATLLISKFEDGRWASYDEEDADCHLFAAAPELLEALKMVIEEIGDMPEPLHTIVRLATAKAEGR